MFISPGDRAGRRSVRKAPYQRETPATGFTVRCRAGVDLLLLDPSGGLATGTIWLPDNPGDDDRLIVAASQAVTSATFSANGATIANAPPAITAGGNYEFRFIAPTNKWVFMGAAASGGGGSGFSPFVPPSTTLSTPTTSAFTLTQGTSLGGAATQTNTTRGVALTVPAVGTSDNFALLEVTPPGSTPYTCTMFAMLTGPWINFPAWGIYVKDNTGKIVVFGPRYNSTLGIVAQHVWYAKWNSINSFNANTDVSFEWGGPPGTPTWVKLVNNGTNFIASISHDGENYITFATKSVTDFLGATITSVGPHYDNNPGIAGLTGVLHVFSWSCV